MNRECLSEGETHPEKNVAFHSVSIGQSSLNRGALDDVTSNYLSDLVLDKTEK